MAGFHSVFPAIGSYAQDGTFTAGSLSADVTSGAMQYVGNGPTCSATVWVESGTPSGTFYVDVTNDMRARDATTANSAKWVTVQSVVYTAGVDPAGNSASQIVWINGSRFARIRWVRSGGSGTGAAMASAVGA